MLEASCDNLGERMTLLITPRLCQNFLSRQWLNHDTTSADKILFFISLFSNNLYCWLLWGQAQMMWPNRSLLIRNSGNMVLKWMWRGPTIKRYVWSFNFILFNIKLKR